MRWPVFMARRKWPRGTLQGLQGVLTERPEPIFGGGQALATARDDIEFRYVRFVYSGRPVTLQDINLDIQV